MTGLMPTTCEPAFQHQPAADDVRAELAHVLASPHLQASEKRRAFLRFIVEEMLAGRADKLKGYNIAVAVFGRDETFDPQTDPVVRLEARRLRRDLDSYYVDAGSRDAVRISIPKGSYVPSFEWKAGSPPPVVSDDEPATDAGEPPADTTADVREVAPRIGRHLPWRGLLAVLLVTVIAVATAARFLVTREVPSIATGPTPEPAVVVLPFEALGASEDSGYLANGISQELITDLTRFRGFRLYTLPIGVERQTNPEPVALGQDLGVAYVVRGSVRAGAEAIRVTAQLFDAVSGRVLWAESFDRAVAPGALISVPGELAAEIATLLGQPYGIVHRDLEERLATSPVSSMESYVCVLRAHVYRRGFPRKDFGAILGCLEAAVRRDPGYSDAWAMLGWLYLDAGRFGFGGEDNPRAAYESALRAASRAVALDPGNTLALKALSSTNHYMGRYDEGERFGRRALELNPHDPDTLAQLGWRLAVRGKFEEGIPLLRRAIQRTVNPPGWYFHLVAIDLCLKEDYQQMLRMAERSAADGSGFSQLLIAVASGMLGERDRARQALEKLAGFESLAHDPTAFFRRHGATDEIVEALMDGLEVARRMASSS